MSEASIQTRDERDQSFQDPVQASRRRTTGSEFEERLASRDATVGVVGLGCATGAQAAALRDLRA